MALEEIRIVGARQHNLKNLTLALPRNRLVVITGPSGAGKSSLAFDTLYAEGQRRYVESLSAYARQFLEKLEKPDVDSIDGLSPAIAIEQRTAAGNPRSTIATVTEIYDYARLLFALVGQPHHPTTGKPLVRLTAQEIVDRILALPEGTPVQLLAPVIQGEVGELRDVLEKLRREGWLRARIDGEAALLEEVTKLGREQAHTIEIVVDRIKLISALRPRITDSVEQALRRGEGVVIILAAPEGGPAQEWRLSNQNFDPETGYRFGELSARHFSFNSPEGACPACTGLGTVLALDPELVVPDPACRLDAMPVEPWKEAAPALAAVYQQKLAELAAAHQEPMGRRWRDTSPAFQQAVLHGPKSKRGVYALQLSAPSANGTPTAKKATRKNPEGALPSLQMQYQTSESARTRQTIARYASRQPCPACGGARLRPEILSVTISTEAGSKNGIGIHQFGQQTIRAARAWIAAVLASLPATQAKTAGDICREIEHRLGFLEEVGLGYLALNRESGTLSGGEAQRIRLASQIGSRLTGVLYILDEPSIGLHPQDTQRLIACLKALRDLGNSVVVVEHDEETIRQADYLLDLGPHAGPRGGHLLAAGTVEEVCANPKSITGAYLSGTRAIELPKRRQEPRWGWLSVVGARENNLQNVTAKFPLGCLTCVTGVSGSGKSTLVQDVLARAMARHFGLLAERPGVHDRLEGLEHLDKMIEVDQTPIGRTPRSNPLTYLGAFNPIRDLFAQTPLARVRGYDAGRFSFNVSGGRCEHCEGAGVITIEMNFLPPVYVPCEACGGRRFNRETLEITYKGRNIADVLAMTVDEGLTFFRNVPGVQDKLEALAQVGLGYLGLGQAATTLSGGEAQRIKLAAELAKKSTGRTLYLLDEPTTGLHWADIEHLLHVLIRLRDAGNTLIVIEHQLDFIACADYVLDLGPGGGDAGGKLVAQGTPEEVAATPESVTGRHLAPLLTRAKIPAAASGR